MTRPSELYLCLYLKDFPAQALLRMRPELRDKPCVVIQGEPPSQRICSLTHSARLVGLVAGMTKTDVESLPGVTILRRSEKQEAIAESALLECAGKFSPRLEKESNASYFSCFIDIAGTQSLFGKPEQLANQLINQISILGMTACIAISHNFYAALATAKGMHGESNIQIIPYGHESAVLAPLPLIVLNLTEEQAETLGLWGIRTLGMLASLPEKELVTRLGQAGARLLRLAKGTMPHLFQPLEPISVLEELMQLDTPVEDDESLLFIVNTMLEQIIFRAKAQLLSLASVTISMNLTGGKTYSCTVRPVLSTNDRRLWIKLIHLNLEARPPRAAVICLLLLAKPGNINKMQLGLFSPQLAESSRIDVTLARVRAIVGDENVGCALLIDTHQQDGFIIEQLDLLSRSNSIIPCSNTRSAIRNIRNAENILVLVHNQQPKSVIFQATHYIIEFLYGPWLVSGNWWDQAGWELEQWDIEARAEDNSILHACLVRYQITDTWQITALYD